MNMLYDHIDLDKWEVLPQKLSGVKQAILNHEDTEHGWWYRKSTLRPIGLHKYVDKSVNLLHKYLVRIPNEYRGLYWLYSVLGIREWHEIQGRFYYSYKYWGGYYIDEDYILRYQPPRHKKHVVYGTRAERMKKFYEDRAQRRKNLRENKQDKDIYWTENIAYIYYHRKTYPEYYTTNTQ
jgi:hypothetical protein